MIAIWHYHIRIAIVFCRLAVHMWQCTCGAFCFYPLLSLILRNYPIRIFMQISMKKWAPVVWKLFDSHLLNWYFDTRITIVFCGFAVHMWQCVHIVHFVLIQRNYPIRIFYENFIKEKNANYLFSPRLMYMYLYWYRTTYSILFYLRYTYNLSSHGMVLNCLISIKIFTCYIHVRVMCW